MTDIGAWLEARLAEKHWIMADLVRASGVSSGTAANAVKRNSVGPDVAASWAKALGLRQDQVFYELGLTTERPGDVVIHDPILADIWRLLQAMTDEERIAARVLLNKWVGASGLLGPANTNTPEGEGCGRREPGAVGDPEATEQG